MPNFELTKITVYGDHVLLDKYYKDITKGFYKEITFKDYESDHLIYTLLGAGYSEEEIENRPELYCRGYIEKIGFNNDGSLFIDVQFAWGGGFDMFYIMIKEKYQGLKIASLMIDDTNCEYFKYDPENRYYKEKYLLQYSINNIYEECYFDDEVTVLEYLNKKLNLQYDSLEKFYDELMNDEDYSESRGFEFLYLEKIKDLKIN